MNFSLIFASIRFNDHHYYIRNIRMHCHGKSGMYGWTVEKKMLNCLHRFTREWKLIEQFKTVCTKTLETLTRSHLSTQREWNSWEQGRTRRICRGSNSHIQTTHDVWSPENHNRNWKFKYWFQTVMLLDKTHQSVQGSFLEAGEATYQYEFQH